MRVRVISHSFLANDPRVRRAVDAFLDEGWSVEGLFLDHGLRQGSLRTWRVPIARKQGGTFRYLFEYGAFFLWTFAWTLVRSMRKRADVVYVNSPPDVLALAASPAKFFGSSVVLDVHDPMPELLVAKGRRSSLMFRLLSFQEAIGIKVADTLITVHEPLAELIRARQPDAEFGIVMNVPDATNWPPISRAPGSRTIVYTGTVANRYGLDDLIAAVAIARGTVPNLHLRVIGDGEDLKALERQVERDGLGPFVTFEGRVPYAEIRGRLEGAWLGANVPKPDDLGELSFSNKVVEWVGIGLPVLASKTATMLRYFPDGTLFYTRGGDPESIAASIIAIDQLDEASLAARIDASKAALKAIDWHVQRRKLVSLVEGARR